MNLFLTLLVLCLIPPTEAATTPKVTPEQFHEWFQAAQRKRLEIPETVLREIRDYRYVFICGLFNEGMPGYFAQNVKELRARGVPRSSIHLIKPDSRRTIEENAVSVRGELQSIVGQGRERLVVIGHSRGACDALIFALQDSRFFKEHIHAMFLVQGPFGGTPVADYMAGEGMPMDRRMPTGYRLMGQAIGSAEPYLIKKDTHVAITSLNRKDSEDFWKGMLKAHREAIPIVAPRTFYVTTRTSPAHHPLLQRVTGWYVGTYYGPNDGLVAVEDQSLQGLGTVLAVLDAGHNDLTRRFPAARPKQRLRNALVDAILMAVGSPRPKPANKFLDSDVKGAAHDQGSLR